VIDPLVKFQYGQVHLTLHFRKKNINALNYNENEESYLSDRNPRNVTAQNRL
jgi:hypothetical protein